MVFSLIAVSTTVLLTLVVFSFIEKFSAWIKKKKSTFNFRHQNQEPVVAIPKR